MGAARRAKYAAIADLQDPKAKRRPEEKEALRERSGAAKAALGAAQRALTALEQKAEAVEGERRRGRIAREKAEKALRRVEVQGLYGRPVPPAFSPLAEYPRAGTALKKLSDAEEKRLREAELRETVKKKKKAEQERAQERAHQEGEEEEERGGDRTAAGLGRRAGGFASPSSSTRSPRPRVSTRERSGGTPAVDHPAAPDIKGRKLDFMANLEDVFQQQQQQQQQQQEEEKKTRRRALSNFLDHPMDSHEQERMYVE